MFNINGWELVLLAILFLVLFGPDRLPSVVVDIARVIRQLRAAADAATADLTREFQAAARDIESAKRTIEQAGADVRQAGDDVLRTVDAAAESARIAPPRLVAADSEAPGPPEPADAAPSDAPGEATATRRRTEETP